MQHSQARAKRQHGILSDDEDNYRASPSKSSYNMRYEGSSHDRYRDVDKRRLSGDRYDDFSPPKDRYRRGRDDVDHRADADAWTPQFEARMPIGNNARAEVYGDGLGPTGKLGWTPPARNDDRDTDFSRWSPKDNKVRLGGDKNRNRWDMGEKQKEWRHDGKDNSVREFQRDNGWESRRRAIVDDVPRRPFDIPQASTSNINGRGESSDRSWEPAPGWRQNNMGTNMNNNNNNNNNGNTTNNNRPGEQQQGQRKNRHKNKKKNRQKQNDHNHNGSNATGSNAVNVKNQREQDRGWRQDDTHLNNWQRRDVPFGRDIGTDPVIDSQMQMRGRVPNQNQRFRSPRSRSRTPESYYSRRSSPGHSPSPESPRRRHRPASPYGPSPSDRYEARGRRRHDRYSRSPSYSSRRSPSPRRSPVRGGRSPDDRGRPRRRSLSSASSMSRSKSRSRSPSPHERATRPVHRLPVATSLNDVRVGTPKTANALPPRPHGRNGKDTNGKRNKRKQKDNQFEAAEMPPPALPASSSTASAVLPASSPRGISPETARSGVRKNAGFKPIGQQSSAVKRFFPGDEDDDDDRIKTSTSITQSLSPATSSKSVFVLSTQAVHPPTFEEDAAERRRAEPRSPPHINRVDALSLPYSRSPDQRPHPLARDEFRPPACDDDRSRAQPAMPLHYDPSVATPSNTRPSSPRGSRDELYEIVSQVGEGTFGKVYKARNTSNNQFVALKRIRMEAERDGFPVTAMREIKLLQSLRQDNVVRLYEMMVAGTNVYMVFEYMDHDLTGILSQNQFSFTDAHLKSLCRQMLAGLAYLHHKGVIHRDIKGSNILINNRGELKLGDFGLARFYQKRRRSDYTNRVITLWYRPPELLFGTTVYGPEVDMWSAGCIMLELFTKKPVFQGNDEIHQLDVVYRILGTPTLERWPAVSTLPWYELVKPKEVIPNHFRELFQKWLSPAGLDLAERLLAYDPEQRATATQALDAPYFNQEAPPPEYPTGLATLEGEWHELETKRERAKKRRKTEGSGPTQ